MHAIPRPVTNAALSILIGVLGALYLFGLASCADAIAQEVPSPGVIAPAIGDLLTGFGVAVISLVLGVELARYGIKPLRRAKGQPLSEVARVGVVLVGVVGGQLLAFGGAVTSPVPGVAGTVASGIVISGLAVLFNETVMGGIRAGVRKASGGAS